MSTKQLDDLLTALNSQGGNMFKYPIGNTELTKKVRELESEGKLIYSPIELKWFKRGNKITKSLRIV